MGSKIFIGNNEYRSIKEPSPNTRNSIRKKSRGIRTQKGSPRLLTGKDHRQADESTGAQRKTENLTAKLGESPTIDATEFVKGRWKPRKLLERVMRKEGRGRGRCRKFVGMTQFKQHYIGFSGPKSVPTPADRRPREIHLVQSNV